MTGETVTDLRKKFEPKEEARKPPIERSELKGLAEKRKYAEENWGVKAKQSQTPTPPKPEVTGGERGVKALKSGIESNIVAVDERWNKTIDFMKGHAPDEIIRVLSGMPDSVEQETKKRAVEVIEAARKRVADEVGKRIAESREMAKDFTEKWRGEQALKSARDRAGPVRELLKCFHHIDEQVALDRATMDRVKDSRFKSQFAELENRSKALREMYTALLPKRESNAEPTEPVGGSGGNPKLGNLGGEEKNKFDAILTQLAVGMSKDPSDGPPELKLLGEEVETIKQQLKTTLDGPKDCAAELKDRGFTWDAVKEEFKRIKGSGAEDAGEKAATYMQRMWWYRRQIVDQTMLDLQKTYNFDWASVGSANLESDYDISIKTHGTKDGEPYYDFQIVSDFNKAIASTLGTTNQPGTIFDTNLYASAKVKTGAGEDPPKLTGPMAAMTEQGQDTGALMKMRRYMNWEEYNEFMNQTLKGIADKDQKADMKRQFEEADSLYFMSVQKQLKQAYPDKVDEIFGEGLISPEKQKELLARQAELEKDSDKMMAVNNELYVEAMKKVRELEKELKKLDPSNEQQRGTFDELLAALKTAQADAVFFAAEAYHSDGPFKHVVDADQGAKSKVDNDPQTKRALDAIAEQNNEKTPEEIKKLQGEKKAELVKEEQNARLSKISQTEMLQSFNENLGDMLKDLGHYDHKSPYPGLGFYRSSKYLSRLCSSMMILKSKIEGDEAVLETRRKEVASALEGIKFNGKSASDVKKMADSLANVRGGKVEFKGVTDEAAEAEAYATDLVGSVLGVSSLDKLGDVVKAVGVEVNSLIRKEIAAAAMAIKDPKAATGYFKVAPKEPKD